MWKKREGRDGVRKEREGRDDVRKEREVREGRSELALSFQIFPTWMHMVN